MREYVTPSLENHLFFGRIMKEHALFLQAGFPAGETGYRKKSGLSGGLSVPFGQFRMGCHIGNVGDFPRDYLPFI